LPLILGQTKLACKVVRTASTNVSGKRTRLPAAERRESILRAAADVFAQAGYRGGKVSEVAARVGVTEPVIFQNFGSKAALFAAVLERAAGEIASALDDVTAAAGSPSALLAHVLSGSLHHGAGHLRAGHADSHRALFGAPAAYGVLFADAAALTTEPELTGAALGAFRALAAHLTDLIRRAQADGGVRPEVDPEAAAWLLLSVLAAGPLRAAAMPAGLEPAITELALGALAPGSSQGSQGKQGSGPG
jgi:AcrR family transcriptional regulator